MLNSRQKNIHISVVVPLHNEERYIDPCIQALLAQDYPEDRYEIIVVDNNSTDRSVERVQQYRRVKLLSEKKQGDFAARNRGILESKGSLIAFTDSDTAPYPDWLQNAERAMSDPEPGVIIGNLRYDPKSRLLGLMADYESQRAEFVFSSTTEELYYGYTCNMIVRRSLFDELGPFPEVNRNSDIIFLRHVIDAHRCGIVRYDQHVSVRRLEISNLWNYYRKHHTYGRDYNRYGGIASLRPLNLAERVAVFKKTAETRQYTMATSMLVFFLLAGGAVAYETGRPRGAGG